MPDTAITIITNFVVSGILTFVFQMCFKSKYEREIEKLKADLALNNFRSSHVFPHTVDVVATTHEKLLALHAAIENCTPFDATNNTRRKERLGVLKEKWQDFSDYYPKNKIYLRKRTNESISAVWSMLDKIEFVLDTMSGLDTAMPKDMHAKLESVNAEIHERLKMLEHDFQAILGLDDSPNSN